MKDIFISYFLIIMTKYPTGSKLGEKEFTLAHSLGCSPPWWGAMVVRESRRESLLAHVGMDQESENWEC